MTIRDTASGRLLLCTPTFGPRARAANGAYGLRSVIPEPIPVIQASTELN